MITGLFGLCLFIYRNTVTYISDYGGLYTGFIPIAKEE